MAGLSDVLLAAEGLDRADPAELELRNVSYEVLNDKRRLREVLSGVTCAFPRGKMSAVMGASGSGKSSLLSLLRGLQAVGSRYVGQVVCDGRAVTISRMRDICNFVAHEDTYLIALTPRETLGYIAQLRLPAKWTDDQRSARVGGVLELLQMQSCADTRIGDPRLGLTGCSGGEKKRLSIGIAIIGGLPAALLCDEPTSSLDSAHAEQLIAVLEGMAERGVSVVCSIHQPAYVIFKQFTHLLLLDAGRSAYCGSVSDVEAFFKLQGFPTPIHVNPADHYVKVVQSEAWKAVAASLPVSHAFSAQASVRQTAVSVPKARVSFLQQVKVLTRRNIHENFKNRKRFFAGLMVRLPPSLVLGCLFWQVGTKTTQPYIVPTQGLLFCAVQSPLIDSFYGGVASFQTQRAILTREYYDGLYNITPFYIGYYLGYVSMQIPWAIIWTVPLYFLAGFPCTIDSFFVFLMAELVTIFFGTAWGSYVGATSLDTDSARSKFVPFFIPMILFAGYIIPFPTMPWIFKPLYYLSPLQWALSLLNVNHYSGFVFSDCSSDIPQSQRSCYATGEEYLSVSTCDLRPLTIFSICVAYAITAAALNVRAVRKYVLTGHV